MLLLLVLRLLVAATPKDDHPSSAVVWSDKPAVSPNGEEGKEEERDEPEPEPDPEPEPEPEEPPPCNS